MQMKVLDPAGVPLWAGVGTAQEAIIPETCSIFWSSTIVLLNCTISSKRESAKDLNWCKVVCRSSRHLPHTKGSMKRLCEMQMAVLVCCSRQ